MDVGPKMKKSMRQKNERKKHCSGSEMSWYEFGWIRGSVPLNYGSGSYSFLDEAFKIPKTLGTYFLNFLVFFWLPTIISVFTDNMLFKRHKTVVYRLPTKALIGDNGVIMATIF